MKSRYKQLKYEISSLFQVQAMPAFRTCGPAAELSQSLHLVSQAQSMATLSFPMLITMSLFLRIL